MVTTMLFGLFALLLLLGAPIATCLGMSSVAAMIALGAGRSLDVVLGTVPQLVSAAITKSVLMAIPFFILGGNIMEKSGISSRLINLALPWCACLWPASLPPSPAPARPPWPLWALSSSPL